MLGRWESASQWICQFFSGVYMELYKVLQKHRTEQCSYFFDSEIVFSIFLVNPRVLIQNKVSIMCTPNCTGQSPYFHPSSDACKIFPLPFPARKDEPMLGTSPISKGVCTKNRLQKMNLCSARRDLCSCNLHWWAFRSPKVGIHFVAQHAFFL